MLRVNSEISRLAQGRNLSVVIAQVEAPFVITTREKGSNINLPQGRGITKTVPEEALEGSNGVQIRMPVVYSVEASGSND